MQTTIVLYVTVSAFWQVISIWVGYLKIIEKAKTDSVYQSILYVLKNTTNGKLLKKQVMVPAMIIMGISVIIASPILFPIELFRHLRRLFFGKSELEKKAEAEAEKIRQQTPADFPQGEGRDNHEEKNTNTDD